MSETVSVLGVPPIVIGLDADEYCVTLCAMSRAKFKNGRHKKFFMFQADRKDRDARIKLPRWLSRALKTEQAEIIVEGGKQGAVWREFSAWCDESSKV